MKYLLVTLLILSAESVFAHGHGHSRYNRIDAVAEYAIEAIKEFQKLKKQIVENDTNINDVKYIDSLLDHYLALSVTHPDIYGQLNHYSQLVAANAFLKTRDIEKASKRLVESCTYDGFILKSFGPNMMVAKRFLEEGHQAPVIEFLQNCQSYWYDRKAYIWEEEISNGTMPDFGENLNY